MVSRSELEINLDQIAGRLEINGDVWGSAKEEWVKIYSHHRETGEHCARSADLGARMGEYFQGRGIYSRIKSNAFFLGFIISEFKKYIYCLL